MQVARRAVWRAASVGGLEWGQELDIADEDRSGVVGSAIGQLEGVRVEAGELVGGIDSEGGGVEECGIVARRRCRGQCLVGYKELTCLAGGWDMLDS
jgi:hypothetical protein